jgi:AGCS family alanine or glycine:cation symporter
MLGGDVSYVVIEADGPPTPMPAPTEIRVDNGTPVTTPGQPVIAWHDVAVERLYTDAAQTQPFSGFIRPSEGVAVDQNGNSFSALYGNAVESGAPLTMLGFQQGLAPIGNFGQYIVLVSVLLFGVSTAISWSYYGDRCANYVIGHKAIMPYKAVYVVMHFLGAIVSLQVAWDFGDIFLGIVILPNLIALLLLSGKVREMTDSYFQRQPWIENAEAHKRAVENKRANRPAS